MGPHLLCPTFPLHYEETEGWATTTVALAAPGMALGSVPLIPRGSSTHPHGFWGTAAHGALAEKLQRAHWQAAEPVRGK